MNKILIIGTEPPCSRCGLLLNVIKNKISEFEISAEVIHLAYTGILARAIAMGMGLTTGTAKDVAARLNLEIDKEKLSEIVQNKRPNLICEYKAYNTTNWSFELDEFLRPFEQRAKEAGILMTPVLLINNEVKHAGSVPQLQKLEDWLKELKN